MDCPAVLMSRLHQRLSEVDALALKEAEAANEGKRKGKKVEKKRSKKDVVVWSLKSHEDITAAMGEECNAKTVARALHAFAQMGNIAGILDLQSKPDFNVNAVEKEVCFMEFV